MSARPENSETWRERAPTQRALILEDLRAARGAWVSALGWNQRGIFRYGARIWELRHQDFHRIEERISATDKVAEYRLVRDADEGL